MNAINLAKQIASRNPDLAEVMTTLDRKENLARYQDDLANKVE